MSIETHVAELRGFLNAVQQLCGPDHRLYADAISVGENEEHSLARYFSNFEGNFQYQGGSPISYQQVRALLQEYVYSSLGTFPPEVLKELDWQLIEYYGLASTAADGSFNPLVSEGAQLLSVNQSHYKKCEYFTVRIPGHIVITSLGICA